MSNFSPKLKDATEDELMGWINQSSPAFGSLASDELSRREMLKLRKSFEAFDKTTSNYSKKLLSLTVLLFFVAAIQLVVTALALPFDLLNRILISGTLIGIMFWTARDIMKNWKF